MCVQAESVNEQAEMDLNFNTIERAAGAKTPTPTQLQQTWFACGNENVKSVECFDVTRQITMLVTAEQVKLTECKY